MHNYLLLAINFNVSFTAEVLTNVTFFAVSVIKATVAATLEQGESLVFAAKLTWAVAAPRTVDIIYLNRFLCMLQTILIWKLYP